MSQTDAIAAGRRRDIDAAYVAGPFWAQLLADGGTQLLASRDLQKDGCFVWNSAVIPREFAERYLDTVVTFLRTVQTVIDRYKADPAGAARTLATHLGAPVEATQESLAGLTYPPLADQISPRYWGSGADTPQAPLVRALGDAAQFLASNREIKPQDLPPSYAPLVLTDLLIRAAGQE
jgi:taurine transport system substrate-binding protein